MAARRCFEWFLGRNDLGRPLYDANTGGCRDALLQDHLNQNQGAESSLAFYLSLAEIRRAEEIHGKAPHYEPHRSRIHGHRLSPGQQTGAGACLHLVGSRARAPYRGAGAFLGEAEVEEQLAILRADFNGRHLDLEASWRRHYALVRSHLAGQAITDGRLLYIGALFSGEYSLESAALFNPSIVPHPDQTGVPAGRAPFRAEPAGDGRGPYLVY